VIDIGAGTGMFSAAMARWLEASVVIGVDPSIPMLMQARRCHPGPGVHYVAGVVVIRTMFRERLDALVYSYWPRLREVDAQRFPSQDEVLADFTAAGFAVRDITSFGRPVTRNMSHFLARMEGRPQSKFTRLNRR
jgi:SAM-dependent methyltransferase